MEFPVRPAKLERFMDDQAVLARIAPNPAVALKCTATLNDIIASSWIRRCA